MTQMSPADAEEYTQALGQVMAGGWRQVALAKRLGVPEALDMGVDEWVEKRLGGYVRLSIDERREAVKELVDEGHSQREAAEILGVGPATVNRDLNPPVPDGTPEAESASEPQAEASVDETPVPGGTPEPSMSAGERAAELIAEFPELEHYADRPEDLVRLGESLRSYDEPERTNRRENLAKAIAAEQRQADEPSEPGPDYHRLADDMFRAANAASQAIAAKGGPDTFEQALADADPLTVENWENEFASLHMLCRQIAAACRPKLRRVK